jgi:hypothetical protein
MEGEGGIVMAFFNYRTNGAFGPVYSLFDPVVKQLIFSDELGPFDH